MYGWLCTRFETLAIYNDSRVTTIIKGVSLLAEQGKETKTTVSLGAGEAQTLTP